MIVKHVLPNALPPIFVLMAVDLAVVIMLEATLSFLGVGVPITEPSLGMMISIGKNYIYAGMWWMVLFPENGEVPCLRAALGTPPYDVMCLGHMDTVFPEGEAARRPFEIRGDQAFGPGVCDMKGGGWFRIEVSGKEAHAGAAPHKGVNAVVELARLVGANSHRLDEYIELASIPVMVSLITGVCRDLTQKTG